MERERDSGGSSDGSRERVGGSSSGGSGESASAVAAAVDRENATAVAAVMDRESASAVAAGVGRENAAWVVGSSKWIEGTRRGGSSGGSRGHAARMRRAKLLHAQLTCNYFFASCRV